MAGNFQCQNNCFTESLLLLYHRETASRSGRRGYELTRNTYDTLKIAIIKQTGKSKETNT